MKHDELVRQITAAGKAHGLQFTMERKAGHELWLLGQTRVVIPGHREIAEGTARQIRRDLQPILGERWWDR